PPPVNENVGSSPVPVDVNPNCVVVSVAGTVTLLIVMLPHVLNAPSAKSFSTAVIDCDVRVCAMNAEMHADVPDSPSSRDTFNPPSKTAPAPKFAPLPLFGMYRHGAGVSALLTIAHARSPVPAVEQSAFVELNNSCSGLLGDHCGSVRK